MIEDARPNKTARVFIELEVMAQWSTCQRGRVGSALVNMDGVILVPSRNGTPYGRLPCSTIATPDKKCVYCVHSERNVINHAARLGVQTQGHNLVTLRRPCINCANDIVQAGIAAVYYRWQYNTDDGLGGLQYVTDMFKDAGIYIVQMPMTEQESTFHQLLAEWRATWTKTP